MQNEMKWLNDGNNCTKIDRQVNESTEKRKRNDLKRKKRSSVIRKDKRGRK